MNYVNALHFTFDHELPAAPDRVVRIPRRGFWTEERLEQIKRLWAEGWSASEIGGEIGATRNAVIGKLHRHGQYRAGPRATGLNPGSNGKLKKKRGPTPSKLKAWELGPLATDLPPDHADKPTELQQLEPHQCRWPCSGAGYQTLFCGGDAVPEYSYCLRHCRMAYVPDRPRPRSSVVYFNSNGAKAA